VEGSNCVYEYNDLWTDKGAGYCLTYENAYNMSNMIFRNNSVGFAIPTWTIRNAALDIRVGANPNTRWGDITFENITFNGKRLDCYEDFNFENRGHVYGICIK
jgi:hypothetical protein